MSPASCSTVPPGSPPSPQVASDNLDDRSLQLIQALLMAAADARAALAPRLARAERSAAQPRSLDVAFAPAPAPAPLPTGALRAKDAGIACIEKARATRCHAIMMLGEAIERADDVQGWLGARLIMAGPADVDPLSKATIMAVTALTQVARKWKTSMREQEDKLPKLPRAVSRRARVNGPDPADLSAAFEAIRSTAGSAKDDLMADVAASLVTLHAVGSIPGFITPAMLRAGEHAHTADARLAQDLIRDAMSHTPASDKADIPEEFDREQALSILAAICVRMAYARQAFDAMVQGPPPLLALATFQVQKCLDASESGANPPAPVRAEPSPASHANMQRDYLLSHWSLEDRPPSLPRALSSLEAIAEMTRRQDEIASAFVRNLR